MLITLAEGAGPLALFGDPGDGDSAEATRRGTSVTGLVTALGPIVDKAHRRGELRGDANGWTVLVELHMIWQRPLGGWTPGARRQTIAEALDLVMRGLTPR
ncbi:hypothetical protein Q4F19_09125 [Sphingomonas sp. BIUV-7]|uniref:TetR family transcriptional regulator n=1 Tax=Sphingomonas natans TaxID=3063330 RepID=A0ABT8YA55_9SPHN|nr:hypothetical protein [Sphingomonas sp. BIUV-7]MDO6414540.1 hypothetical protein [Sphingomonas sp. BIUV-7]